MLQSPCYVFSDAHLGATTPDVEKRVLAFLRGAGDDAGSLIIAGDLFDFWFEWRSVIPRTGFRVLGALADLAEAGVPVLLTGGNHDCWGGDVLRKDAGILFQCEPWTGDVAGWRAHVEHGDGLRPEADKTYRRIRRVLRHPASVRAFRMLHPDLGNRIASWSSATSRDHRASDDGAALREVAFETMRTRPDLDLVIYGHSHVPALARAPEGGVYGNAGSWLQDPTYLRITPERIALLRWTGSPEGEHLHALDRGAEKALP